MPKTISGHDAIRYSTSPFLRRAFVPGRPIWIATHRSFTPLFLRLLVLLDQVEPIKLKNTWSYNYRAPRMGDGVSDHAGYAIDAWSDGIGMHTWPPRMDFAQAKAISAILEQFKTKDGRHIFGWGACNKAPGVQYTGPTYNTTAANDPMHFYIARGVNKADAAAVIKAMGIQKDGTIKKTNG